MPRISELRANWQRVQRHQSLVPIPPLAEAVRAAVAATLRGLGAPVTAVDVWVDDLRLSAAEETP